MFSAEQTHWPDVLRRTLLRYEEPLLRRVAARLIKPRNQWPTEELVDRCAATAADVTVVDRRLRELAPAGRQLLALIGHSRQPVWALGNLVELIISLGHEDGLAPVLELLEAGLLFPFLPEEHGPRVESNGVPRPRALKSFEQWLAFAGPDNLLVFAHPLASRRAVGEDLGLGTCPGSTENVSGMLLEADGLEWPLRLAVLWQQVLGAPLRRTLQREFFKRDLERIGQDPLLNASSAEGLPTPPDAGFLGIALAEAVGILNDTDGELHAGRLPAAWEEGLPAALEMLYRALPRLRSWTPLEGWRHGAPGGNPFPSAGLLCLLLLDRLPAQGWARPQEVQEWITARHPFWASDDLRPSRQRDWASPFLLGLAYPLRIVQAARSEAGDPVVRLSPMGRWLLGLGDEPASDVGFPKTLLVQPNLEIVAYRQGLTPGLIGRLTRFADWRSLGSACTLQLGPDSIYRALESGLSFDEILQTLEKHGTRPTPSSVVDSLRTWSNKRERISVYPSAALVEFGSPEQLSEALARGFPGQRISDRLAVVPSESAIDYSLFRLTSSRDYAAPPEQCVSVGPDGVTLTVDLARADLLLESELTRFAESLGGDPAAGSQRRYRLTPDSMAAARAAGLTAQSLDAWFLQRVGETASAAALLLLEGNQSPPAQLRRYLILQLATEEMADGLVQWPATAALIEDRLGPTALSIAEENVVALGEQLSRLGIPLASS
jgi:Helicase conserved C-terminal domain